MGLLISDVEKITGISKDRLRYYEEKNLIIPERNEDNSYRTHSWDEITKLFGIQLYRSMDIGVKDIQSIQKSEPLDGMREVFKRKQEQILSHIAELQKQNKYVECCIEDCEKIDKCLNNISLKKVKGFHLLDRLEDSLKVEEYEKFKDETQEHKIIIRSFVRRLELTPDGIGENVVFVSEEDKSEQLECVYTVVVESANYDPMMETYAKFKEWITKMNISVGSYCYVRPLLISHLGNNTVSYLEVFAPIKENQNQGSQE